MPLPPAEAELRRIQQELEIHQIELEMQNEELRAAHAEVATALARYADHFDFAPVGFFNLTADGAIQLVNLTGAKLLGEERARLPGRQFGFFVVEPDRHILQAFLARVFASTTMQACEVTLVRANQTPLAVLVEGSLAPDGQECRAVVIDITERKAMAEQLRQSQKVEAFGQLAGGVAHDFNNILGAMLMQIELAEQAQPLTEDVRNSLRAIRADAMRAANLTRQLLLFSRRHVLQLRNLDLNEVVTNLVKLLQRIIGEDMRLELHLHPAPLILHADAGMIEQILMNLAVNARDAMPNGGSLRIETSEKSVDQNAAQLNPEAAPGRYVCLRVSDQGHGIAPAVMSRIFDPFFTTKDVGKGTGLGLATVMGIVKQHRGWVMVESQPGQGATFQIFLPASSTTPGRTAAAILAKPGGGTETILLVEDEMVVRVPTRKILERHGYKVLEAASGQEALECWQQHRGSIALLLTDLVMPGGMSGQELARVLQADEPQLRVIFNSGYSAAIAGRELKLGHGEHYIQKPVAPDQLLRTLRLSLDS